MPRGIDRNSESVRQLDIRLHRKCNPAGSLREVDTRKRFVSWTRICSPGNML